MIKGETQHSVSCDKETASQISTIWSTMKAQIRLYEILPHVNTLLTEDPLIKVPVPSGEDDGPGTPFVSVPASTLWAALTERVPDNYVASRIATEVSSTNLPKILSYSESDLLNTCVVALIDGATPRQN